jgi:hypothetical protein
LLGECDGDATANPAACSSDECNRLSHAIILRFIVRFVEYNPSAKMANGFNCRGGLQARIGVGETAFSASVFE